MSSSEQLFLRVDLPSIPELDAGSLEEWNRAHEAANDAEGSVPDVVLAPLRRWSRDRGIEALAGVTPSISGQLEPPLFPAPRRFLSAADGERLAGVRHALDHVDVRLGLLDAKLEVSLIQPETVQVLHALIEGRDTGGDPTNPGLLRVNDTAWSVRDQRYTLPPAELTRPLLDLLTATVADRPASPPALAAWSAFTLMSIHPFVDGNGRTARLLHLFMSSLPWPVLDLAVFEGVAHRRDRYVAALRAGQETTSHWDPALLDAGPFTIAMTQWSIDGANRRALRAEVVGEVAAALASIAPDADDAVVGAAVLAWLDRGAAAWGSAGGIPTEAAVLESGVRPGLLARRPSPASRRPDGRGRIDYRLGPRAEAVIDDVLVRRSAAAAQRGDRTLRAGSR